MLNRVSRRAFRSRGVIVLVISLRATSNRAHKHENLAELPPQRAPAAPERGGRAKASPVREGKEAHGRPVPAPVAAEEGE